MTTPRDPVVEALHRQNREALQRRAQREAEKRRAEARRVSEAAAEDRRRARAEADRRAGDIRRQQVLAARADAIQRNRDLPQLAGRIAERKMEAARAARSAEASNAVRRAVFDARMKQRMEAQHAERSTEASNAVRRAIFDARMKQRMEAKRANRSAEASYDTALAKQQLEMVGTERRPTAYEEEDTRPRFDEQLQDTQEYQDGPTWLWTPDQAYMHGDAQRYEQRPSSVIVPVAEPRPTDTYTQGPIEGVDIPLDVRRDTPRGAGVPGQILGAANDELQTAFDRTVGGLRTVWDKTAGPHSDQPYMPYTIALNQPIPIIPGQEAHPAFTPGQAAQADYGEGDYPRTQFPQYLDPFDERLESQRSYLSPVPVVGTVLYTAKASEDGFTKGELANIAVSTVGDVILAGGVWWSIGRGGTMTRVPPRTVAGRAPVAPSKPQVQVEPKVAPVPPSKPKPQVAVKGTEEADKLLADLAGKFAERKKAADELLKALERQKRADDLLKDLAKKNASASDVAAARAKWENARLAVKNAKERQAAIDKAAKDKQLPTKEELAGQAEAAKQKARYADVETKAETRRQTARETAEARQAAIDELREEAREAARRQAEVGTEWARQADTRGNLYVVEVPNVDGGQVSPDSEPSTETQRIVTQPDLPTPVIRIVTPSDLPTPETQRIVTPSDLPTPETQRIATPSDLPTPETQRIVTPPDLPTPETQRIVTQPDLPTPETQRIVTQPDLPTPVIRIVTPSDLPTPVIRIVTPSDLPTPETRIVTQPDLPTPETQRIVTPSDLPTPETPETRIVTPPDLPTPETRTRFTTEPPKPPKSRMRIRLPRPKPPSSDFNLSPKAPRTSGKHPHVVEWISHSRNRLDLRTGEHASAPASDTNVDTFRVTDRGTQSTSGKEYRAANLEVESSRGRAFATPVPRRKRRRSRGRRRDDNIDQAPPGTLTFVPRDPNSRR